MSSAGIFVLPVLDQWLVHAPLHGVTALSNRAAVRALASAGAEGAPAGLEQLARAPVAEPAAPQGPPKTDFVGLVPTRACNLACTYCAFGAPGAESETLSLARAVAAVDWMAQTARALGRQTLDVHFFGGEPFCAGDVVDVAVHRARARAAALGLRPYFQAATNGCFDDMRCGFIGDYIDTIVLSIDGPPDFQDAYRPFRGGRGSFATVYENARALAQTSVELILRLTLTSASVRELSAITRQLCIELHPETVVFEPLQATSRAVAAGLTPPGPEDFARAAAEAFRVARGHGVRPVFAGSMIEERRASFCPVGRDTLIVAPDGGVSACYMLESDWVERGLDLSLGHVSEAGQVIIDDQRLERVRSQARTPARCERCFARWHCAGGCRVNVPAAQSSYGDFCVAARLLTVFELLERLDRPALATTFLNSGVDLKATAHRPSDLLADWEASDERG